jgi:hypothetical protein
MTRIKEILREAAIDPREDGPMAIIIETAASNPRYAEDRAVEFIREAQAALNTPNTSPLGAAENLETYHFKMKSAMSLLAIARSFKE